MVNDIQENAFHAYLEDWEEALLTTSEADNSTARFRLATKYMGMVMFDAEVDEWRVVVDLEWTSKRAYGPRQQERLGFGVRAYARPPRYRDCSRSRTELRKTRAPHKRRHARGTTNTTAQHHPKAPKVHQIPCICRIFEYYAVYIRAYTAYIRAREFRGKPRNSRMERKI